MLEHVHYLAGHISDSNYTSQKLTLNKDFLDNSLSDIYLPKVISLIVFRPAYIKKTEWKYNYPIF